MSKINVVEKGISYLLNKTPKGKINPKELGWIRPDGIINFQTAEAAQSYAKNRVISALHAPKPFERAVFVEDSKIISDIDGATHHVHFDSKNVLAGHKDVTLVHGHPGGTPLSDQDYACLTADKELKSIIAYNKRGEFSKMTKQPPHFIFRLLPKKVYEYVKLGRILYSRELYKEWTKCSFEQLITMIKNLQNNCKGMTKEEMLATEDGYKIVQFAKQVLTKINNIWSKNEKEFGIKYECNFSKLR